MELIKKYYETDNWFEVKKFINGDEYFVSFLLEVAKEIIAIFGEEVSIHLVKEKDPEIKDEVFLVAYISSSELKFREMFDKLKTFEEEWYFDNMSREKEGFDIDIRYKNF